MYFHNPVDAEHALIGILAGERDGLSELAPVMERLSREDFSDDGLGRIFAALQALHAQRTAFSLIVLDERLTKEYGADQALKLMDTVMTDVRQYRIQRASAEQIAGIVQDASLRRRLIRIGGALARGAADDQRDTDELIDAARTCLAQSVRTRADLMLAEGACLEAYEAAEHMEKPVSTGIRHLDDILCGGLHRGELTILGARPAVGKSAVLLQMAAAAAQSGARVALVSLEMSARQIGVRLLSSRSGVNAGALRTGSGLGEAEWQRLADGLTVVSMECGGRLALLVRGCLTVEELRAQVQSLTERGLCDLLFIDYLQLLRTRRRTSGDTERLGIVSRGLKELTLDFDIPVVAAAQVKRQNNAGVLRAPTLDELRGSGDMEQDADNVILLHRPAPDDAGIPEAFRSAASFMSSSGMTVLTLDVAKQRQGITAQACTLFNPSRMRFCVPEEIFREEKREAL